MTPEARTTEPPPPLRVRRRVDAGRERFERSWASELWSRLKALDFGNWTLIFGAELLWSAVPLMILLSSLANERIDDDLSHHIGLDSHGAHIVSGLFRNVPAHAVEPIATGLLFSLAGCIAVVASLQVIYERTFDQEHRGWRDLPRFVVWLVVLLALLVGAGSGERPVRTAAGSVLQLVLTAVVAALFFAWTIHFLLAGRVAWRRVLRPAIVTAVLWVGLAGFSSLYFSSVVVEDSRLYGTIGVVFSFLTWFIMIGSVIVLGAAGGAVWEARRGAAERRPVPH